jgi:hypothetical protein
MPRWPRPAPAGANAPTPEWTQQGVLGRVALMGTEEYPGRTMQQQQWDRLGPRLGVAWSVNPKTVIRGGYGLIWMTLAGQLPPERLPLEYRLRRRCPPDCGRHARWRSDVPAALLEPHARWCGPGPADPRY